VDVAALVEDAETLQLPEAELEKLAILEPGSEDAGGQFLQ
jgi:hypothetical protein